MRSQVRAQQFSGEAPLTYLSQFLTLLPPSPTLWGRRAHFSTYPADALQSTQADSVLFIAPLSICAPFCICFPFPLLSLSPTSGLPMLSSISGLHGRI